MKKQDEELLNTFRRLGTATDAWVAAHKAATDAASALTAATAEVNAARADMVKLVTRYDVHAPGNYGFERRLADLLAFLASAASAGVDVVGMTETESGQP